MRRLVLIVMFACSSSNPRPTSEGTPPPPEAPRPRMPPPVLPPMDAAVSMSVDASAPAGCPATYAGASGKCGPDHNACSYPEGQCYCGEAPWCGGAAPPRPDPSRNSWQCTPTVRADGCPGHSASGACTKEGQKCDYTCSCVDFATCTKGQWTHTRGPCKP